MSLIEKAAAAMKKHKIKPVEVKRIRIADEGFYRRSGGRHFWLMTFEKAGKLSRVTVLSEHEPTPAEAMALAMEQANHFSIVGLKELLGSQYNRFVAAAIDAGAHIGITDDI